GLHGTLAHEGTHTDLRDDAAAASHDLALRLKLIDQWRSTYHDIGSLTLLNTVSDCARCSVGDCDFVPRRFFKVRDQCDHCRLQGHGAKKLNLSGSCRTPCRDAKQGKSRCDCRRDTHNAASIHVISPYACRSCMSVADS